MSITVIMVLDIDNGWAIGDWCRSKWTAQGSKCSSYNVCYLFYFITVYSKTVNMESNII